MSTAASATSPVVSTFKVRVERVDGYEFRVRFDKDHWPELRLDEPPPLGRDAWPNAARLLAASIGNCLAASLCFCLEKSKVPLMALESDVTVNLVRNEQRRLRVGSIHVLLEPKVAEENEALTRCLADFEDFCVVTESVRQGIDVRVSVGPVTDGATGPTS